MQALAIIEPIDRDVQVLFPDDFSPVARSRALAEFATEEIASVVGAYAGQFAVRLLYRTFVDGRETQNLESVKPDGVIEADFDLLEEVLSWIGNELRRLSPVLSGQYQKSHVLYADGREVFIGNVDLSGTTLPVGVVPAALEYVWLNPLPYAHKIELGSSEQASRGVYEVTAGRAAQMFGDVAKIRFEYRAPLGGGLVEGRYGNRSENRRPAISITLR